MNAKMQIIALLIANAFVCMSTCTDGMKRIKH